MEYPCSLQSAVTELADTFTALFTLFDNCNRGYNSSTYMSDEDIEHLSKMEKQIYTIIYFCIVELECSITGFMDFYRDKFPTATVLPKMHILEEHVIPWVQRWRIGAGLMGEQGAESVHQHFMKLERVYQGIPCEIDRLRYIMKEHQIASDPSLSSLRPAPKKRKIITE